MMRITKLICCAVLIIEMAALPVVGAAREHGAAVAELVRGAEGTWRKATRTPLDPGLTSREIFTASLALCEGQEHLERLPALFDAAATMIDRDPGSKSYGNFRWTVRDMAVMDYNGVEFCMHPAMLLWTRHGGAIPADTRAKLRAIIDLAAEGCMRHKIRTAYTNIALMNASNLVLMGETFERPDLLKEGLARLDAVFRFTLENGTGEYDSPTYYGVDLDVLATFIGAARNPTALKQARALQQLLWTDITSNWFTPAQRLAGANSRTYDYLHGTGGPLDAYLAQAGMLDSGPTIVFPVIAGRDPVRGPAEITSRFPRTVRQCFGPGANQFRTHVIHSDVTLSTAAEHYGPMDMPLTFDFPGKRTEARGYFIPDSRGDPYGLAKVPQQDGHLKAEHLRRFFWAAAQRGDDALGLIVYGPRAMPDNAAKLLSHFVVPGGATGYWIADRKLAMPLTQETSVRSGEALVIRKGSAAVGIRIVWSTTTTGSDCAAALIDDSAATGALRLTLDHDLKTGGLGESRPGAAFWVRAVSGLNSDSAFETWRKNSRPRR